MDITIEAAFLAGSESAFEEIITQYSPSLLRYCYGILGSYYDAQDVVQNVMVKLYYKRSTIKESKAIKVYIYKLAYNECIDLIRKYKRNKSLNDRIEDSMYGESGIYDNTRVGDGTVSEHILAAMIKLKPEDRALVYGIAVEEKSYSDMSLILHKPEITLRKRYERARKKLKELLNSDTVDQHF